MTIVFAEQNTKNRRFFSTCGSFSFFLSVPILSEVCSSLSFALLTGRYKAEHKPHIKNRPAIPRMAHRQPKALSSAWTNCVMANAETDVADATSPTATERHFTKYFKTTSIDVL